MSLVRCFHEDEVIGMVEYTDNLDYWDGRNHTCGSTGRHLGIGKTKDGRFYLCHGSQWQGERDYAVIVTEEEAKRVVLRNNPDVYEEMFDEPVPVL